MSTNNKSQHRVPKSYLNQWKDPVCPAHYDSYVWYFSKDGGAGSKRSPKNLFEETDAYTVKGASGFRDLYFENGLSQVETGSIVFIQEFLSQGRQPPDIRRLKFSVFLAFMMVRTKAFIERTTSHYRELKEIGQSIVAQMELKTPEERDEISRTYLRSKRGNSLTEHGIETILKYPVQVLGPLEVENAVPKLMQMRWIVYEAPAGTKFITSDNPAVMCDGDAHNRPLYQRELLLESPYIEFSMALSPRYSLLICHDFPIRPGVKPIEFRRATDAEVREFNSRTCEQAHEFVVSSDDVFEPDWLLNTVLD